jgi:hypothetical protein
MDIASVIAQYQDRFIAQYGHRLTREQRHALEAMLACRTAQCGEILLNCPACEELQTRYRSCGHRSCPRCQHHDTTRWLERQSLKLLPVEYYLVTFTLPYELRGLARRRPSLIYDILFHCAVSTLQTFAGNDRKLGARIGMTAVLHTHSRRLAYHPHVHLVVPGGCLDTRRRQWKTMRGKYLFNERALARVFRARVLAAIKAAGLGLPVALPSQWVAHCARAGRGLPALKYLSRYLYRGVISEENIIANDGEQITFRYRESQSGNDRSRTMRGEDFVWLLLQHVLPKGFRRVRDYGFLHGNARALLRLVQRVLGVWRKMIPPEPTKRPAFPCCRCGHPLFVLGFRPPGWQSS